MSDEVILSRREFIKLSILSSFAQLDSVVKKLESNHLSLATKTVVYMPVIMSARKTQLWVRSNQGVTMLNLFIQSQLPDGEVIIVTEI